MTFDNLVFVDHPNKAVNGIMAKYRFNNGKELSVVAGDGLYCSTRWGNRKGNILMTDSDVASFEVMIGEEIVGWQSREQITEIIKKNTE